MDSATDSGGRVTRALRKRIASIDSENSSRPGTPVVVPSKLAAPTTTNSPLKTRMTRRNSTSGTGTPVLTPSKRVGVISAIAEGAIATPPRRITRRRSISNSIENDGTPQQLTVKAPNFVTLTEEVTGPVTRSKSKSPEQPKLEKPTGRGRRKSVRNVSQTIDENAEKRIDGNNEADTKEDNKNATETVLPPPDTALHNTSSTKAEKNDIQEVLEHSTSQQSDKDDQPKFKKGNEIEKTELQNQPVEEIDTTEETPASNTVKKEIPEDHCDIRLEVTESMCSSLSPRRPSVESVANDATNKINISVNDDANDKEDKEEVCKTPSPPKHKSPSVKTRTFDPDAITPAQNLQRSSGSISFKVVAFNSNISDDECEKSIYPKTPGSSKSKSLIEITDSSFQGDVDDSVLSVGDTSDTEIPETQQDEVEVLTESISEPAATDTKEVITVQENVTAEKEVVMKSPKKSLGKESQSSTKMVLKDQDKAKSPANLEEKSEEVENQECILISDNESVKATSKESAICNSTQKNVEIRKTLTPRKEEGSLNNDLESCSPSKPHVELKWCNPSVVATGTKLDTIVKENSDEENAKKKCPKSAEKPVKKKHSFLKRSEWKSDEEMASDDEEEHVFEEEEDEEEPYRRKHAFHDDEAMVVDDYESGDSMDSEERRDMVDNEIPVDGESIGSHTTDGEDEEDHGDEEECEEDDSFIVSDNDDEEEHHTENDSITDSDDEDEEVKDVECNKREKKKPYKRIQRMQESSTSSSDEQEEVGDEDLVDNNNDNDNKDDPVDKADVEDNNALNSTKLSDSALRLQDELECDASDQSNKEEMEFNKSRKEILRKLNQSDRFNKSVRDLNPEVSPEVEGTAEHEQIQSEANTEYNVLDDSVNVIMGSTDTNGRKSLGESFIGKSNVKRKVTKMEFSDSDDDVAGDCEEELAIAVSENEIDAEINEELITKNQSKLSESRMKVTSDEEDVEDQNEEAEQNDADETDENDNNDTNETDENDNNETDENEHDKENEDSLKTKTNSNRGLSMSFGHFKAQKKDSLQKKVLQRSFTIGVRISGGDLGTAVIENKPLEMSNTALPSTSSSSNEENDNDEPVLSSEDIRYIENIKHMPLGNPLVRTRRQSLALPTNPDNAGPAKKPKRKSLGILSGNDFNPSQSFVDSLELRKAEINRHTSKRKRLSKSFCGTSERLDTSIIDLDAHHLHKRSKLAIDSSFVDSLENLSTNKPICSSNMKHSSTPHEKVVNKNDNNNNNDISIRHILNRCDEILEAANRAKLESKINNNKSKVKLSKKSKKKLQRQSLSPDSKCDKLFAPLTKEFKRKDKIKKAAAVTRALKASADIIIGKQQHVMEQNTENSKRLPTKVLESIAESEKVKTKKNKKEPLAEHTKFRNYATSAGNVIETMQTPEKKKKPKIIRLPTGKVCVEPITPKKKSILTANGTEFRESPATPCGLGFRIQFSALDTPQFGHARDRKRKRNGTEDLKKKALPKPQWTQSGLFMEEEVPQQFSRLLKKHQTVGGGGGGQQSNNNFKQNALSRADVKRSTAREILQLRERRQFQNKY